MCKLLEPANEKSLGFEPFRIDHLQLLTPFFDQINCHRRISYAQHGVGPLLCVIGVGEQRRIADLFIEVRRLDQRTADRPGFQRR